MNANPAKPDAATIIVSPVCNYITYFYLPESDPFTNKYAGCLTPYVINMENSTVEKFPDKIFKEIYTAPWVATTAAFRNTLLLALGYRALRDLPRCTVRGSGGREGL